MGYFFDGSEMHCKNFKRCIQWYILTKSCMCKIINWLYSYGQKWETLINIFLHVTLPLIFLWLLLLLISLPFSLLRLFMNTWSTKYEHRGGGAWRLLILALNYLLMNIFVLKYTIWRLLIFALNFPVMNIFFFWGFIFQDPLSNWTKKIQFDSSSHIFTWSSTPSQVFDTVFTWYSAGFIQVSLFRKS